MLKWIWKAFKFSMLIAGSFVALVLVSFFGYIKVPEVKFISLLKRLMPNTQESYLEVWCLEVILFLKQQDLERKRPLIYIENKRFNES